MSRFEKIWNVLKGKQQISRFSSNFSSSIVDLSTADWSSISTSQSRRLTLLLGCSVIGWTRTAQSDFNGFVDIDIQTQSSMRCMQALQRSGWWKLLWTTLILACGVRCNLNHDSFCLAGRETLMRLSFVLKKGEMRLKKSALCSRSGFECSEVNDGTIRGIDKGTFLFSSDNRGTRFLTEWLGCGPSGRNDNR